MRANDVHKFNYQEVKVDIPTMRATCLQAVRYAKESLYKDMTKIIDEIDSSLQAERDGNLEKAYREMCHANTGAGFMMTSARDLERAVHSLFAMSEALRRENITFMRPDIETNELKS